MALNFDALKDQPRLLIEANSNPFRARAFNRPDFRIMVPRRFEVSLKTARPRNVSWWSRHSPWRIVWKPHVGMKPAVI